MNFRAEWLLSRNLHVYIEMSKNEAVEQPPLKKQKIVHGQQENVKSKRTLTLINGTFGQDIQVDNKIKAGDLVMVYIDDEEIRPVIVISSLRFDCKCGTFTHDMFIDRQFGSKVTSIGKKQNVRDFVYLLRPTPTLWTLALKHRTQILYNVDISYIVTMLQLRPGSRVIEAGTGSGSLSTTIARLIHNMNEGEQINSRRRGHLFTFEYHEQRFKEAREEFRRNGFDEGTITITHGDVCANGFKNSVETDEEMEGTIDAIFLDLPKPWQCIENVDRLLRVGGRFCGFSPCIEQIQKTADALRKHDFVEVRSFEVLSRIYREDKVVLQKPNFTIATSDTTPATTTDTTDNQEKSNKNEEEGEALDISMEDKTEAKTDVNKTNKTKQKKKDKNVGLSMFISPREMRGHTGYLIFASKYNRVSAQGKSSDSIKLTDAA